MATTTTNLGLTMPGGSDKIRIAQINTNMQILDEKIGAVGNTSLQAQSTSTNSSLAKAQNGLAYIVGNTNTTGDTLAVGQFVYVKGHSTITEGLRKVTASISSNGNITTSNTSECPEGIGNALNSNLIPLLSSVHNKRNQNTESVSFDYYLGNWSNGIAIVNINGYGNQIVAFSFEGSNTASMTPIMGNAGGITSITLSGNSIVVTASGRTIAHVTLITL